jgi:TRAP-type C4-dicarboxylate transport system substrate-binding protein
MEETKEKMLADKMSGLSEEKRDAINNAINESLETAEAIQDFENDPDVQKLKAKQVELMGLISDPKVMKAYRAVRKDVYGEGERRQVSKKEKKKKKAKRRMVKKSKK